MDALEKDVVDGLKEYTADNLLKFLTRQGDKDLIADLVKGLGGRVNSENDNSDRLVKFRDHNMETDS